MSSEFDQILETALAWHADGKGAAIATVVETWGSAPRPVGAQLAISGQGEIVGSVSAGCVEAAVIVEAIDAISDGKNRMLEYGVSDGDAFAVGLACGGRILVMVEPLGAQMPPELLGEIIAAKAGQDPIAYVVDTVTWDRSLAGPRDYPDRFRDDKSGFEADEKTFVTVYNPPLKLIIVGAGHIAQPLSKIAGIAGFDVRIVDPRETFATSVRFPGLRIYHDWPDAACAEIGLDARTGVVTLAHDPKIDDPAIIAALGSDAFYVGCLGSRRTHAKRVERLSDAGLSDARIAEIHGPVGINIGSRSPAEIALSIVAQMIQELRSR